MTYKDAFNITYENALEDGATESEAERMALSAMRHFAEQEIDRAEFMRDCAREWGE